MNNLILDISDPKEVFLEKFVEIYNTLEDDTRVIPIIYGNYIIYCFKKPTNSILKQNATKNYLKTITLIFPNRMLCFADKHLHNLINSIYVLLNYYEKTLDINVPDFGVNFDRLNISIDDAKYSDCD